MDADEFRQACRDYALISKSKIKRLILSASVYSVTGTIPYLTMKYDTEANIVRSLGKIVANGHLHQRRQTGALVYRLWFAALAEAEVDYKDKTFTWLSTSNFLLSTKTSFIDTPCILRPVIPVKARCQY